MNKNIWDYKENNINHSNTRSMKEWLKYFVTPQYSLWRESMDKVVWGIILQLFTVQWFLLDYMLPVIGMILLVLGFRMIRKENAWFKYCFVIVIIQTILMFGTWILHTTIHFQDLLTSPLKGILYYVLKILFLWCFRKGLKDIGARAQMSVRCGCVIVLLIWQVIGLVFLIYEHLISDVTQINYSLGVFGLIIFAVFMNYLLRKMFCMVEDIDEAGYTVATSLVRIKDRWLVGCLVVVLTAGCIAGYLFGGSYIMKWKKQKNSEYVAVKEIKNHLIECGFPKEVLEDIAVEDIKNCSGALQVLVKEQEDYYNDYEDPYDDTREENKMGFTFVMVELPENQWRVFHHFQWITNPGFYGTEMISLYPAYNDGKLCQPVGEITGHILYDEKASTFVSSFYSVVEQEYHDSWMASDTLQEHVFCNFSWPEEGENYRGYVSYGIDGLKENHVGISDVTYYHQDTWMQYPAQTAMESVVEEGSTRAFVSLSSHVIFDKDEEGRIN